MNALINFIIRSNIFVALCAASLVWQTSILMSLKGHALFETWVVFLSTGFIYNLHRMQKASPISKGTVRSPDGGLKLNRIMAMCFLIAFIPSLFYFESRHYLVFLVGGLFSLAYSFSFIKIGEKWYSLRTMPFTKLFAIVFVWTLMTAVFPLEKSFLLGDAHAFILLERIFFLLAITIPFDIRDMVTDKEEGIKTFPIQFGWIPSKRIAQVCALAFMLVAWLAWSSGFQTKAQFLALSLSALLTLVLCQQSRLESSSRHFTLALEGLSLVQSLLVGLFYFM